MNDVVAAPTGAEPAANPTLGSEAPAPAAPAEPTAFDLADDSLIRIKGSDKPVKFSDHVRGFQSQATKASQRAAELERKLAEREQAIQRYEQQQRQAQSQSQSAQVQDTLSALRQAPYISGEQAAQIVGSIASELGVRDQYILQAYKEIKRLRDVVGGLHESSTTSSFDSKISKWLTEGGYPVEFTDLAKEIYLAYEGDDLDAEFPNIFRQRYEQIQAAIEGQRRAAAEKAKRVPFVPGKGAAPGPSKPLTLNPRNSASQDAEALWEQIQLGSGT